MSNQERSESLRRALFAQPHNNLYAVLDGAAVNNMLALLAKHGIEHVCLLRGELDPELAQVAPYLVRLPAESSFTELLISNGWGNNWGIFAVSAEDFRTMRMHLRQCLEVWDPDGVPLFFRYYDPRVLRVFLPTCDDEQLEQLFGPVSAYVAEGESADELLRFGFSGTQLSRQQIQLTTRETQ